MKSFLRALVLLEPFCFAMCGVLAGYAIRGEEQEGAMVSAVALLIVGMALIVVGVVQGVRSVVVWFRRFRSRPVIARARVVKRR